jgi:hypothetical protein
VLFSVAIVSFLLFTAVSSQPSTMRTQQQPVVEVRVPVGAVGIDGVTMMQGQCHVDGASIGNGGLHGDACAHIDVASSFSVPTSGGGAPALTARRSFATTPMVGDESPSSSEKQMATDGHVDSAGDVMATDTVMDGEANDVCWYGDGDAPSSFFARLFELDNVVMSALGAGRSTATRVLAGSLTSRFQTMSPALIDGTGTAATPAGKTATRV